MSTRTDYDIITTQTAPHADLLKLVKKHADTSFQKPIHPASQKAFHDAEIWLKAQNKPIILDLGCGTGMSTAHLARDNPDCAILGIDRSAARLSRATTDEADNVLLLRADCVDFCRLALEKNWPVKQLYFFYPNPYPKYTDITKRWHGHPIFPTLLALSQHIEVRSNWPLYLKEFALAAKTLKPVTTELTEIKTTANEAISLFEKKYIAMQTPIYRLILKQD